MKLTRHEYLNLFTPLRMKIARFAWHNGAVAASKVRAEVLRQTGLDMDMQWAYDYGCFIWGNTDWKCSDTFRVQWNEITPEEIDNDGTVRRDGKIGRVIVNVEGILSVNFI